jgi:hypothetical protein
MEHPGGSSVGSSAECPVGGKGSWRFFQRHGEDHASLVMFVLVGLRCSSLSSLRGKVGKCVKARPPEFCEVLEYLDELMLVIGRYSCHE